VQKKKKAIDDHRVIVGDFGVTGLLQNDFRFLP